MSKENKLQNVILILLAVTVVAMSVGFAAFSTNLNINGSAKFNYAKWDVKFDGDSLDEKTGSVTPTTTTSVTDTTLTYSVTLDPGEFYEFDVDVVNDGTFDAKLSSITFGTNQDPATVNSTYSYVDYTFEYAGTEYTANQSGLNITLAKNGGTAKVHVKVDYPLSDDASKLQTTDEDGVTLNFTVTLGYVQA